MIKFRQAYYCNLKVLLLCLVIYGHMIEPQREHSSAVYQQYWWIYLLHMPLFAFLSGLFLQNKEQCLQQINKYLPIYVFSQIIAGLSGGGRITIITPFWHLWYLLSLCFWLGAGWLWFRYLERNKMTKKKWILGGTIIVLSVLFGAVIGYIPWINRAFSVSRTIVFFPFFFAGVLCQAETEWNKYRRWGILTLGMAGVLFLLWGRKIPAEFLYHAEGYKESGYGFYMRLLCYLLSALFGFFILTVISNRRVCFTKAGTDTFRIYLLHAPAVLALRKFAMPWPCCAICTVVLYYIFYKAGQWNSQLFGITNNKRRGSTWLKSKKFTKNIARRSTGFYCP